MLVHLVKAGEHLAEMVGADGDHHATGRWPNPSSSGRRPSPKTRTCWPCRCRIWRLPWHSSRRRRSAGRWPFRRAERCRAPRAGRAGVGQRFERGECLRRDDEQRFGRIEIASRFGQVGAVDVRDEAERQIAVAVGPQGFISHDRAEIGAADADVDDVFDRACRCGPSTRRCGCGRQSRPSCRAPHELWARRFRHRRRSMLPRGARRATCSTGRFSVVLIRSPANIASMRSRKARFFRQAQQQPQRFVGNAVFGVVEIDADRVEGQLGCRGADRRQRAAADAAA